MCFVRWFAVVMVVVVLKSCITSWGRRGRRPLQCCWKMTGLAACCELDGEETKPSVLRVGGLTMVTEAVLFVRCWESSG